MTICLYSCISNTSNTNCHGKQQGHPRFLKLFLKNYDGRKEIVPRRGCNSLRRQAHRARHALGEHARRTCFVNASLRSLSVEMRPFCRSRKRRWACRFFSFAHLAPLPRLPSSPMQKVTIRAAARRCDMACRHGTQSSLPLASWTWLLSVRAARLLDGIAGQKCW